MKVFTASFFGHRQIDNVFVIEQRLQEIIQELLISKEYVEFLVGRDGEFDQLVASTVRRCKRTVRGDNSALVLVLPYVTAEYRNNEQSFHGLPFGLSCFLRGTQLGWCLSNNAVCKEIKYQHRQFVRCNPLISAIYFQEG